MVAGDAGFASAAEALEWCEDDVLGGREDPVPLAGHDLLAGLPADAREAVIARCVPRRVVAGAPVLDGDAVLALQSGRAVLDDGTAIGRGGIVSRLDPGVARAAVDTVGAGLPAAALASLERERPDALAALWRSLAAWARQ